MGYQGPAGFFYSSVGNFDITSILGEMVLQQKTGAEYYDDGEYGWVWR